MFYLIYVSSATKLMDDDALLSLLQSARDENEQLGITGMLLYQDGNFMQMLEGKKQTVLGLYEKLKNDNRHKGILTILTGDIDERNYEDWSMGFLNMDKSGELSKYSDYINENLTLKSFNKDSQDAYVLMSVFKKTHR